MKATQITTINLEKITYWLKEILRKDKVADDYSEDLKNIMKIFLDEDFNWDEMKMMEFLDLEMHIFHYILAEQVANENYELCSIIMKVIEMEYKLFQEFINNLPDDDDNKNDYQEEYNYTKLYFKK